MSKKLFWLGLMFIVVAIVFPVSAECQAAAGTNQSTVTITRDPEAAAVGLFYIYIDDELAKVSSRAFSNIGLGETVTILVDEGPHSIYVKVGSINAAVSNTIEFTANRNNYSFYVTTERVNRLEVILEQRR